MPEEARPAFYALAPGGVRDYVTLLHPPYTAWHLSYVVIGAAVAGELEAGRVLPTLAAFFLAVGIAAHALDELHGRPLRTEIPARMLVILAALAVSPWILLFVAAGAVAVVGYSSELWGGRLHGDLQFALAWGSFPVLTGAFATAERIEAPALLAAAFAFLFSLAQRRLSTQVRDVRRRVARVEGRLERRDGTSEPVTTATLIEAEERALRLLAWAVVVLALALVGLRAV